MKIKRTGLLAFLLAVVMLFGLSGAAFASGEASGETSSAERDIQPWPSLQSNVYTAADGDEAASFLCYGVFDEMGDIVPFEADIVEVTLYDAQEEGEALGTAEAVYDEEAGGWAFTLPLPEENSVYWASFDGSLTSPVYIVVDEAETTQTLYNATIASGGVDDGMLALSEYAPIMGVEASDDGLYYDEYLDMNIVRPYISFNDTLFTAADFSDMADATAEETAAVNWWLASGFTNGGDSYGVFGYDRDSFYTFELTLFIYRYFGVYDNAYGVMMSGYTIGSEPYFVSIQNTNGTGIIDDIEAVDPLVSIDCSASMSYQDILATLYNAMTSAYAHLSEAGKAAAASLPEAETALEKAEAMAGLLGVEVADYSAAASKMEAIELFYALAQGNYITALTYPDTDYALATSLDVEGVENADNGNDKTAAYEVYAQITEDCVLEGEDAVFDVDGNMNALVVSNGAKVVLIDPYLTTTTTNSDYGFGGGAVLLARDSGTVVSLIGTDGSINVDVETGSSAGGFLPLCNAAIYNRNIHIYSPGTHTSNLTYNGVLWYDQSAILGSGRIFSTDYWGGYLVYNESVSVKHGTGGSVLDETSIVYYKNSYICGSATSEINGGGTVYYENCIADFGDYYEFHNNTSYWTDTGSLYAVNSVLNFGESFYWTAKAAKSIVTVADSQVTLEDDSVYAITLGYTTGGSDFMTGETIEAGAETESYVVKGLTGDAADQVNGYSILRLYGDSSLTGGEGKLYIGVRYTLEIQTDEAFQASGNIVELTIDRTEDGNTGALYVDGVLVEGAGVHDFGGVVITVIE
ncbi:MAG: hypothetical protein LUE21_05635 [Oscillospiraceae bacterium]|nr:hypothetical protein [Oscillospiraceae bacterium]